MYIFIFAVVYHMVFWAVFVIFTVVYRMVCFQFFEYSQRGFEASGNRRCLFSCKHVSECDFGFYEKQTQIDFDNF